MSSLRKAVRIASDRGPGEALRMGIPHAYNRYVRPHLPHRPSTVVFNGVRVRVRDAHCPFDRFVPFFSGPWYGQDKPEYEAEAVTALEAHADPGDRVVVIGGGYGVTAVAAARAIGPGGSVVVYEGAERMVEYTRDTAERNGVADRVSVDPAVVTEANYLRGDGTDAVAVDAADLPACDVLEMDCEGAELDILKRMTITPRTVIVETHGLNGAPVDAVREVVERRGYVVGREELEHRERQIHHLVATLSE